MTVAEKRRALVMCSRVDNAEDITLLKPGAQQRECMGGCGETLWVSLSTLAMEGQLDLVLVCNPCGRHEALVSTLVSGQAPEHLIAPGALNDPTPDDRRRRNELEARGFRDLRPEDL